MTEITKIDGSPGAGKSHQLQQFLKKEVNNGLGLGDFSFVTFTNAATDDVVPDVADILGVSKDDAHGAVRTLHSMALSEVRRAGVIDDYDKQIISQKSEKGKAENPYQEFADRNALTYEGVTVKDTEESGRDGGSADKLYKINSWLSLTRRPNDDARLAPFRMPWNTDIAVDLLDSWDTFKQSYYGLRRFEHPDYVDEAIDRGLTPDIEVLFVDEFQDLSPQEYLYYKVIRDSNPVKRVYIAGDPNQSVYSFRAGTPHYFNETDYDNEIYLSETRRCRGEIADFARRVLNVGPGADTDFNAHKDGGAVKFVDGESDTAIQEALDTALADGKVFMLARTNSKVYSIKRWLKRNGYLFDAHGDRQYSMWTMESLREIAGALRRLDGAGDKVNMKGINAVIAHSPADAKPDELEQRSGRLYTTDSVWRAFPYADSVGDIVSALDFEADTRDAIKQAALHGPGNDHEKIVVGTIHAAKGLEAPSVLLFNSYNKHLRDAYYGKADTRKEEHRLAYVGATRAEDRLFVVDHFFDGPKMTPLEKARQAGVTA